MANEINIKLRNECQNALDTMKKLNIPNTEELQAKLEWCIGSYDFDNNPTGLSAFGSMALQTLRQYKELNPRKVAKKKIDELDAAIKKFETAH